MSFLWNAAPVFCVIVLVTLNELYGAIPRRVYPPYNQTWPPLRNQNPQPWGSPNTTPWPVLRPYYNPTRVNFPQNKSQFTTTNTLGYNQGDPHQQHNQNERTNQNVDDNDLRDFSEALLSKDVNNAASYVIANYQSKTTSRSTTDEAPLPLISVNQAAFNIPSIATMMKLYDNYVLQSNVAEQYTQQEKNEEEQLLNTVISTPVMQHTRRFLMDKGRIGSDLEEFKATLREIWFETYARGGGRIGSSGFEHVFLAEIKKNQVSGLHNWLYFYEEEKKNQANYLGYLKKIDLGNKGSILKYHFTFQSIDKPVGSMFIGTSPELEMALYSTCFLLRADKICPLKLNGHRFIIRTYTYRYHGKNLIGSAFPEI